ncbi:MAG: hypothetical protein OXF63_09130 [Anaerolineaceae bacterium]|nr:hypothetical protein [Anaerolineaceae bacterium]
MFSDEDRADWLPAALAAGACNGELISAPVSTSTQLQFINSDLFEAAGIEVPGVDDRLTCEQVADIAAQLTQDTDEATVNPDPRAVSPGYLEYEQILQDVFQDIRTGADVEESLNPGVARIESEMAKYHGWLNDGVLHRIRRELKNFTTGYTGIKRAYREL